MCRQAVAKICDDVGHAIDHIRLLVRIIDDVKELSLAIPRDNQLPFSRTNGMPAFGGDINGTGQRRSRSTCQDGPLIDTIPLKINP